MASLETSMGTAHKIEEATKEQSSCAEWHQPRRSRITSTKFREVCHTRAHSSAENLRQAGLTPEVHLGGGPQGSRERGKKEGSSGGGSVQGRKGEGGRGEEEGRGLGGRQGRGLGGRQGRRRKRSGAGDEGSRGGGGEQGSMCVRDGVC